MEASQANPYLLQSCQAPLLTFRLEQFGEHAIIFIANHTLNVYSIFRPTKTATQSGAWNSHHWRMDWDVLQKGHRWENPLMGWQGSADAMQGTHLNFKSKEDAILFAQKQGYEYFVQEPNIRKFAPKAYASQFVHIPGKVKQVRTK
jgi:NADH dehydrogenase (ubiquinone) Fe-S protein 4